MATFSGTKALAVLKQCWPLMFREVFKKQTTKKKKKSLPTFKSMVEKLIKQTQQELGFGYYMTECGHFYGKQCLPGIKFKQNHVF